MMMDKMDRGELPASSLADGVMILVAGALLMAPGILTDAFGFSLLVPGFRNLIKDILLACFRRAVEENRVHVHVSGMGFDADSGPVVDIRPALLHGPEQIADLPVPVVESPGAVRIGHPERGHLVEYLAPNSVFNSLPRQRSCPHLGPDGRFVTIDRVLHHASLGAA